MAEAMPNDPTTPPKRSGTPSSRFRRSQRALSVELLHRAFPLTPVAAVAPDVDSIPLTAGDPWNGAVLDEVPIEPESVSVRSTPTATRPMEAWILEGALVAPADGVVVTRSPRSVVAESINTGAESLNAGTEPSRLLRRLSTPRPATISGTVALLHSPGRNHYHSLVDNLARASALGVGPLSSIQVDLLHHGPLTAVERLILDRLQPGNVTLRPVDSADLVRAEQLVLPAFPAWRYSGWLPSWYLDQLRGALLPDRPSRRSERLYIVRRGMRRLINEQELLERLERHGFRPVDLEEYSFPDQVALFYDAEAVVAAHGAGLTNLLFADKTLVIEISPTQFVFPHYALMCRALGHHHRFVLGVRSTRWEAFETRPSQVEDELVAGLEYVRHQSG